MKKLAIICLLLCALLTACAAKEEKAPAIRNNGFVSDGAVLNYYKNSVPCRFDSGVAEIEGKAYYVEADGLSICALRDCLAEKDGALLYFTEDSSLAQFDAGFVTVNGDLYYAPEDGYALCAAREQIVPIGGSLYVFDENCRVTELSAGVQEIFDDLYYVPEDGIAIACPPEGPLLTDGGLYYAHADGTLAADETVGRLFFGADGRYTSGSETLDEQVEEFLLLAGVSGSDPIEDFRLCYEYLRDHFRYLSMEHYPAGSDDWAQSCAEVFFENGKGNCYCWAAAQMYCARRLGIQAYVVAGWESSRSNDHAWMMAEIDGTDCLFDAELEYSLINIYGQQPPDQFMVAEDGGTYNGYNYFFP